MYTRAILIPIGLKFYRSSKTIKLGHIIKITNGLLGT